MSSSKPTASAHPMSLALLRVRQFGDRVQACQNPSIITAIPKLELASEKAWASMKVQGWGMVLSRIDLESWLIHQARSL
jgi:hypothetical protein